MKSSIKITERDIQIFRFLHACKVASRKQIAKIFFSGSRVATQARLSKLMRKKLILKVDRKSWLDNSDLYGLSKNGFLSMKNELENEIGGALLSPRFKSDSIDHDLDLVEIRYHLESHEFTENFWMENQISSYPMFEKSEYIDFKTKRFDAVIEFINKKGNEYIAPLNYERSVKHSSRYIDFFEKLYLDRHIPVLFVVCVNKLVTQAIQKIELSVSRGQDEKVYYLSLDSLLSSKDELIFKGKDSGQITLLSRRLRSYTPLTACNREQTS